LLPLLLLSLLQLLRRTWLRLLLTQLRRHARADGKPLQQAPDSFALVALLACADG
jgi:hypothetical protein